MLPGSVGVAWLPLVSVARQPEFSVARLPAFSETGSEMAEATSAISMPVTLTLNSPRLGSGVWRKYEDAVGNSGSVARKLGWLLGTSDDVISCSTAGYSDNGMSNDENCFQMIVFNAKLYRAINFPISASILSLIRL